MRKTPKKNRKILFVVGGRDTTCSFYRAGGISKSLRQISGYDIQVRGWAETQLGWQGIYDYDIVMIHGAYTKDMLTFAAHVKSCGIPLWVDYDDDYLGVTGENRAFPVFENPAVKEQVKEFYKLADVISVTNEHLKSQISEYNDNIWVIPNAFNDSIFDVNRKLPKGNKVVFWRGSDTHIYDLAERAVQINKLTKDNPDWAFTYMGYNPWFLQKQENVAFVPALDVIDYFHSVSTLAPMIAQVPLHDTSFNRSKSNIAFIEGCYFGAVCLIPEWWGKIPGTISYTDSDSYERGLQSMLSGELDLKKMNKLGWDYIKKNHLLSKVNKLRFDLMKSLLNER